MARTQPQRQDTGLAPLFAPRSVAVVGASDDATKVGGRVLAYLASGRFAGNVVAVNPKRSSVMGVAAVPSIDALAEPVDTAIIALPAHACVDAVTQCVRVGVGCAVVMTSGFAEAGADGALMQRQMLDAIRGSSTRILGPNCLGAVNERIGYVGTFATMWSEPWLAAGGVAIVCQSGATASYLFIMLRERGIGISAWVATGNEADIDAAACVAHLARDDTTRVVVVALEGVRNGTALLAALEDARTAGKAVVILKVGRSAAAMEAVRSHTAALAGDDRVFDAAMRQAGAVRCASYDDAVDVAAACALGLAPKGRRIGIVSASGGAGILMADRADERGLAVPMLSPALRATLDDFVPAGSSRNPVDVTAMVLNDLGLLAKPIATLRASGEVDTVVAFLTSAFRSDEAVGRVIAALGGGGSDRVPLVLSAYTSPANLRRLFEAGLATYIEPTRAIDVVAALERVAAAHAGDDRRLAAEAAIAMPDALDEVSLLDFFRAHGIACVRGERVATSGDAAAAAARLGFPVAMKVAIPGLAHKADIGGVRISLADEHAVSDAFDALSAIARRTAPSLPASVVVQPMVHGHREMMIGFHRDEAFGPVVVLGFGGAWVEVIDDVVLRLAPFDLATAHAMIDSLRGRRLLDAVRGQPASDIDALAATLVAFSRLVARLPGAASAELNPVILRERGAIAVDAKLVPSA